MTTKKRKFTAPRYSVRTETIKYRQSEVCHLTMLPVAKIIQIRVRRKNKYGVLMG